LLGLESDDIDIALDDMFGEDFAKLIKQHSTNSELQSSSIGVIKSNSEKSKHLETATIRVEG
jgi:tRNA nucleotidyltransferase/poly(A) polymerase